MKNNKGQFEQNLFLVLGVILFLVGVTIIFSIVTTQTTTVAGSNSLVYNDAPNNQTFTLTPVGDGIVAGTTSLSNGTLVSIAVDGTLVMNDPGNQTVTATYTFQPLGFISGISATIVSFIPVLVALAALAFVGLFLFLIRE